MHNVLFSLFDQTFIVEIILQVKVHVADIVQD